MMKKIMLATTLVASLTGMGMLIGCGGSSSGSADNSANSPTPSTAALDTRAIENIGSNIAKIIPGCVFTSNAAATIPDMQKLTAYRAVYSAVTKPQSTKKSRALENTQPINGSCGGTMTFTGSDTDGEYVFNNFCNGSENVKTTINGSVHLSVTMQGTGDNQELKSASVSTGSGGISAVVVDHGQTTQEKLYLNQLNYTAGNPNRLTIKEFRLDSTEEGTYKLTDVAINQYGDPDTDGTVEVEHATYYDPKEGPVTLTTSKVPVGADASGPGWFTLSRNGQKATFTTDDIQSGKFDVEQNGKKIGALDCSATVTEIQ